MAIRACSVGDFTVSAMKAITHIDGGSEEFVENFWWTMKEFSTKMRLAFMQFATGQSRLSAQSQIHVNRTGADDNCYPVGHTCGFSVDVPEYSSKEIMKQ